MMTWASVGIDVPPDRTEGEYQTTCAKCSGTRRKANARCLSANLDKGLWHCHHCGWSGSLSRGEMVGSQPPKRAYFRPMEMPREIGAKAAEWLRGRGIPQEVIERNGIVSGPAWMPQVEDWVSCLWFPYRHKGQVVNVKFRDGQKNFRMVAGAQRIPYGLDDIGTAQTVIWVEGEIDKLSVEAAGYQNCLSVPDGAPAPATKNYASKFDFLDACQNLIEGRKHILAVDADEPGTRLREELARRLGKEFCSVVEWPEGCKDANETLQKHGSGEVGWRIDAASPYPIEGLHSAESQRDKVELLYSQGWKRGVDTTWPGMNDLYRPRSGEFSVVTGIPGHGKSSFVDALMLQVGVRHDWRFAVFSPENWPIEGHIAKLAEILMGFPFEDGPKLRMDRDALNAAMDWLQDHVWWIEPAEDGMTLDGILEKARAAVRMHGVNGIVIDPWNEIDHARDAHVSETEHVSQSLSRLRRFCRSHDVHVWLVAHPMKLQKDKTGKYPVPTPYDIAGSANFRNKADNCLTVWRDLADESKAVEIHVQKIRFRECGRLGVALLHFDKTTGRYHDAQGKPYVRGWGQEATEEMGI